MTLREIQIKALELSVAHWRELQKQPTFSGHEECACCQEFNRMDCDEPGPVTGTEEENYTDRPCEDCPLLPVAGESCCRNIHFSSYYRAFEGGAPNKHLRRLAGEHADWLESVLEDLKEEKGNES